MNARKRRRGAQALPKGRVGHHSPKGLHVKVGKGNFRETIPLHKELKRGLERALFKRLEQTGKGKED